jgi:hypothetical protein
MGSVKAGELRTYAEVHTATEVRTPHGDRKLVYAVRCHAWINVAWELGTERDQEPNIEALRRATVTMRRLDGLKAEDRLVFDGQTLELEGPPVNVDQRNEMLQMKCVERTNV